MRNLVENVSKMRQIFGKQHGLPAARRILNAQLLDIAWILGERDGDIWEEERCRRLRSDKTREEVGLSDFDHPGPLSAGDAHMRWDLCRVR